MWWPQLWPGYDEAASIWQPVSDIPKFGIWPLILGTLKVTIVAMAVSVPLGVGAAVYVSQYAGPRTREIVKPVVELLAGIPSVVLGFFALMVMATWFQNVFHLESRLNALVSGVALSFAVIPVIFTLSEEALRAVPRSYVEASIALGAARWQTIARVILPAASPGIAAGVALGLGRAVGETMIVLMASGNAAIVSASLADSTRTISATIAAELAEVVFGGAHYTVLFFLGTLLFLVTFGINTRRRLGDPPDEAAARERDVTAGVGSGPRDARRSRALAAAVARRTRKNLFADGALAVASGATLLIVLVDPGGDPVRRRSATGRRTCRWAFLTAGAARRHDRGRDLPGDLRHGRDGHPDDARRRADRRRHRDLPARVRLAGVAGDARDPDRGRQPGRRAVDRVRPVRPRLLRAVRGRRHRQDALPRREGLRPAGADLGGADDGGADPAGGDRRDRGGAARRAARAARGVAGARRHQVPDRVQRRRARRRAPAS